MCGVQTHVCVCLFSTVGLGVFKTDWSIVHFVASVIYILSAKVSSDSIVGFSVYCLLCL